MNTSKSAALLAATVLCVSLAGCGNDSPGPATAADPQQNEYLQSLYEDAVEQGQTDVLGYVPNTQAFEPLLDDFNDAFPDINVELVPLFGPELDTRLNAETATGGIQADFTNVGEGELLTFRDRGWLSPFVPETAEGLDEKYIGLDELWVVPQINVQGPVYNTDKLSEDEVPTTWDELASPELAGRVGNTPPTSAGGFPLSTTEANNLGLIDEGWVENLAKQNPSIYQTSAATVQALVSGEIDLYTSGPYVIYHNAKAKGAPLGFGFLEEGNVAITDPVALFKDSPNQAGAKLFMSWLFTPEAQELALEETGRQGTMPGAPKIEGLGEVHLVPTESLQNDYAAWRETLARILG